MICLLCKGRSGVGQCDQDIRLTSIVGNNKKKIRIKIVEGVEIRSYMLKTLLIASTMLSEAALASTTTEFSYC